MEFCKTLVTALVFTVGLGSLATATAAGVERNGSGRVPLAQIDAEQARQRAIDFAMAPVKSSDDLSAYLRDADRQSPLMALSPGARQRFLGSLRFNENGLVSYEYDDLARELTASQAYRLLSLFGAQRTTHLLGARIESSADEAAAAKPRVPQLMADHEGYKCVSPHNCYSNEFYICMTGC